MLFLAALALPGCVLSVRPLAFDFRDHDPDEAFDLLVDALVDTYAFTEHKQIDWEQVRADTPDDDADRTLRRLVEALPDGHVTLWNDDPARDLCPEAAGSLGVVFSDTDAGDLIVASVEAGSAAQAAGIAPGAVLVTVDGADVEDAIAAQPLFCSPVGLATNQRRRNIRVALLSRAPVGASVTLGFADGDVVLQAVDAGDSVRDALGLQLPEKRVDAWMLPAQVDGAPVGYIAVGWEETVLSEVSVRRALVRLWKDGARSLVLDLRDNDGGTDQAAANIVGMFTDRTWFYETITMYDRRTEGQAVISDVFVEPQEVTWDLPVAVLVNGNTVSSGDGMAMMLARFDGVEVVGFEGTAASFGSGGSTARLPGGWTLTWPAGRSLDEHGEIQLDSDATLEGGVQPTHRIPWTVDTRVAHAADPHGFAIDYAVEHVLGAP